MDLLETVLRNSNAYDFIESFRKNNIEATTLPLLQDADLETLGIKDEKIRKLVLKNSSNLQIPCEKKIALIIDTEYAKIVLYEILQQLNLHYANLSCALTRKDIVICDVTLVPATECLMTCVESLENKVNEFENMIRPKVVKPQTRKKYFVFTLAVIPLCYFVSKKLFCV